MCGRWSARRARRPLRANRCRCSPIRSAWPGCPPSTAPPVYGLTRWHRRGSSSAPTAARSTSSAAAAVSDIEEFWTDRVRPDVRRRLQARRPGLVVGLQRHELRVLRRRHRRPRQRRVLPRRQHDRLGPRRADAVACARPTATWPSPWCWPTSTATRSQHQAGIGEHEDHHPGRRTTGRLSGRRLHALGGRGQFAALHAEHRRRAEQSARRDDRVSRPAAQRGATPKPLPIPTVRRSSGSRRSSSASPTERRPARQSTRPRSISAAATYRCCCASSETGEVRDHRAVGAGHRRRDGHRVLPDQSARARLRPAGHPLPGLEWQCARGLLPVDQHDHRRPACATEARLQARRRRARDWPPETTPGTRSWCRAS